MRSRPWMVVGACAAAAVTGALSVLGFGALLVGRSITDDNLRAYLSRDGLPSNAEFDSWGLLAAEFITGAVLALVIVVLAVLTPMRRHRNLRPFTIAALSAAQLWALVQILDGIHNIPPSDLIGDVYPAWFFPLNLVQGLLAVAGYVPAIVVLSWPATAAYFRRDTAPATPGWGRRKL